MVAPLLAQAEGAYSALEVPYHVRSLSMSAVGVADARGMDVSVTNPALLTSGSRRLLLSVIQHPADIRSAVVELRVPWGRRQTAFTVRHMGYGIFDERDKDGVKMGEFTAGDTWASLSLAQGILPAVAVGATAGIFLSQIENVTASLALVTLGAAITIPRFDGQIGFSLRNIGTTLDSYTGHAEPIPTSLNVGITKKLAHLPLELSIDGIWWRGDERGVVRLGGEFTLRRHLFLRWGSSSYRIEQVTGNLWRDVFTETSLGLGFQSQRLSAGVGMRYTGVGGAAIGVGISTTF